MAAQEEEQWHEMTVELTKFGATLCQHFKMLYYKETFSDLKIKLHDNEIIPAHRCILAVWSPIFKELFVKDKSLSEIDLRNLSESKKNNFKHFLHYIYTGTVRSINSEECLQLLALADDYKIEGLKNECGEVLAVGSGAENLGFLLDIANRYTCESLKKKCGEFLAENFQDLMESGKLFTFDVDIWVGIVSSPKVKAKNEEQIFQAVIDYANRFPPTKRQQILETLLPHILFHSMSIDFIVNHVDGDPKLKDLPIIKKQTYEVYKRRCHPSLQSQKLRRRAYNRIDYVFDPSRRGSALTLSNENRSAQTTVAWNQAQTTEPIVPGSFIEFIIDQMCPVSVNSYGICIGIGPNSAPLNGPTAIIGYNSQPGISYVGNNGTFFPPSFASGVYPTFTTGDIIKVAYHEDNTVSFFKNNTLIASGKNTDLTSIYPTVAIAQGQVSIVV